jgi:hypothetical protein
VSTGPARPYSCTPNAFGLLLPRLLLRINGSLFACCPERLAATNVDRNENGAGSLQLAGACGADAGGRGRGGRIKGEKSNLTMVCGCRVRAV